MKPHIYRWHGDWNVSRNGAADVVPKRDARRATFAEACHLAQLAAIHSGLWRPMRP